MAGKKIINDAVTGDYNITVDFAYEIIEKGGLLKYREIKDVPIIKRVTEKGSSEEKCKMIFHGTFDPQTGFCPYFVEARKICFVLDQDNDQHMHSNYENYRCNYLNHDEDYVMFFNMRWHANRDPTLVDYSFGDELVIDILFSKAPEVQTLNHFDVKEFDFDYRNYNLEFTVMLAMGIVSIIICATFIICSRADFFSVSEPYKQQLKTLEEKDDPEVKALRYKRQVFEMKKEENRLNYELEK